MGVAHVRALITAVAVSVALAAPLASHEIGTTRVEATIQRDHSYAIEVVTAAAPLLSKLEARAKMRRSENLSPAETHAALVRLLPLFVDSVELRVDGIRQAPSAGVVAAPDPAQAVIRLRGALPRGGRVMTWSYALSSASYSLTVREPDRSPMQVWIEGDATSAPIALAEAVADKTRGEVARQYLALGFTHIVPFGLDHILFVLGLFLLAPRLKPVLTQVTTFTIAHSLTLALTMYGVLTLSPRIVEPLIALSIVFVAVENLFTTTLRPWRIALVFAFGLIHGMGFAGVLRELGLPRREYITALVTFNIGVEAGQLAVIGTVVVLFAYWTQHKSWYRTRFALPASALIGVTGLFWSVQRIL